MSRGDPGEYIIMSKKDNTPAAAPAAMETAARYLSSRMRTVAEVREHLKSRGYSDEETDEAVSELIGFRYLDDYQYALRYFEYNRDKHRGSMRAARELAGKGIDAETVRYAREDFLYSNKVDEYADALEIALKEISAEVSYDLFDRGDEAFQDRESVLDDRLSARIARKLDGKGFDRSDIFRVLDELRRRYD